MSDSERPTLPIPARPGSAPSAMRDFGRESREIRAAGGAYATVGERRGFFRVRTELEISIEADSHVFTAVSVNLCPGGLLLSTYRALPRGLVVGVEFDLPASRVVAQAVVRWACESSESRMPGYGLSFTDLPRFDRTLIESHCARLAPEAYPRHVSSPPAFDRRLLAG